MAYWQTSESLVCIAFRYAEKSSLVTNLSLGFSDLPIARICLVLVSLLKN